MLINKILKSSIIGLLAGLIAIPVAFGATTGNNENSAASAATSNTDSILSKIKSAIQGNSASFNTVSRKLDALLVSTMEANANLMYQFDSYLTNADKASAHLAPINQLVQAEASNQTRSNVEAKLAEVPYAVMDSNKNSSSYKTLKHLLNKAGGTTQRSRVENLANTSSTDTLGFSSSTTNKPASLFSLPGLSEAAQTEINDHSYNVDALMLPQSYNTEAQKKAANNFITYLSQNYKLLNSSLINALNSSSLKNDAKKLQSLKGTIQFQNYLVNNRSKIAAASIPLSNFYHMYSERANLKDIIDKMEAGGQTVNPAIKDVVNTLASKNINSLLELQNYVANHRVTDQKWRQKMASASPATVQRETLFVLAEIESQLQRMHLDNERLLATVSGAQLQLTQATAGQDSTTTALQDYVNKTYGSG
jgi:intracellular multiplication protein IcmX